MNEDQKLSTEQKEKLYARIRECVPRVSHSKFIYFIDFEVILEALSQIGVTMCHDNGHSPDEPIYIARTIMKDCRYLDLGCTKWIYGQRLEQQTEETQRFFYNLFFPTM